MRKFREYFGGAASPRISTWAREDTRSPVPLSPQTPLSTPRPYPLHPWYVVERATFRASRRREVLRQPGSPGRRRRIQRAARAAQPCIGRASWRPARRSMVRQDLSQELGEGIGLLTSSLQIAERDWRHAAPFDQGGCSWRSALAPGRGRIRARPMRIGGSWNSSVREIWTQLTASSASTTQPSIATCSISPASPTSPRI
jgi:hypothetical protein